MPLPVVNKPSAAIQAFLDHAQRRTFANREVVLNPGDPADTLFYIIDGSVAISLENDEGNDLVLDYLNAGSFIGEMGLFVPPQHAREVTVTARAPCTVAGIPYDRLGQLARNELHDIYPEILTAIGTQLSQRLLKTARKASDLAYITVSGRIANTLLDLCQQPEAMTHPDGMQIRVTRTELGRITGCSREMAGRVLKSMEEQGLVSVKGKTIVVFGTR